MNSIWHWFAGLATVSGMMYFLTGFGSAYLLYAIHCYRQNRSIKINWRYAGIAIGAITILFVSMQTQIAYNLSRETAQEVQDCQREFNKALRTRAQISDDNDRWSRIQRTAVGDWLHAILVPPPEIQYIRNNDPNFGNNPEYLKWGIDVTTKYSLIIQRAQDEQDANQAERAQHPLPEPTCGK